MQYPNNLRYTKTHEWVQKLDETTARMGLSDFAQHELGDIVYIALPEAGDAVTAETSLGDVESVKTVSELISPVTGTVEKVNAALSDAPELVNEDPYGAWVIEVSGVTAWAETMDAAAYEAFCKAE